MSSVKVHVANDHLLRNTCSLGYSYSNLYVLISVISYFFLVVPVPGHCLSFTNEFDIRTL